MTHLAPGRCDRSPCSEGAACTRGIALSSGLRRDQAETGFVPIHRPPDAQPCAGPSQIMWCYRWKATAFGVSLHHRTQITFGVKPSPQIFPALLMDRSNGPELMPAPRSQLPTASANIAVGPGFLRLPRKDVHSSALVLGFRGIGTALNDLFDCEAARVVESITRSDRATAS